MAKKIAFNAFLSMAKVWVDLYGNLDVNNFIIWSHIDLQFGHIVRFHIKSWYKKNLCERPLNAKVMSSGAFVFVLKSLFWKVPKYGDFVEVLK